MAAVRPLFVFPALVKQPAARTGHFLIALAAIGVAVWGESHTNGWWFFARWLCVDVLAQIVGIATPIKAAANRLYFITTLQNTGAVDVQRNGDVLQFSLMVQLVFLTLSTFVHAYASLDAARILLTLPIIQSSLFALSAINCFGIPFTALRKRGLLKWWPQGQASHNWEEFAPAVTTLNTTEELIQGKIRPGSVVPSASQTSVITANSGTSEKVQPAPPSPEQTEGARPQSAATTNTSEAPSEATGWEESSGPCRQSTISMSLSLTVPSTEEEATPQDAAKADDGRAPEAPSSATPPPDMASTSGSAIAAMAVVQQAMGDVSGGSDAEALASNSIHRGARRSVKPVPNGARLASLVPGTDAFSQSISLRGSNSGTSSGSEASGSKSSDSESSESEAEDVVARAVAVLRQPPQVVRQASEDSVLSTMDWGEELASATAVSQQMASAVAAHTHLATATQADAEEAAAEKLDATPVPVGEEAVGEAAPDEEPASGETKADDGEEESGEDIPTPATPTAEETKADADPNPALLAPALQPATLAPLPMPAILPPAEVAEDTGSHVLFLDAAARAPSVRGLNPEEDPLLKATRSARNVLSQTKALSAMRPKAAGRRHSVADGTAVTFKRRPRRADSNVRKAKARRQSLIKAKFLATPSKSRRGRSSRKLNNAPKRTSSPMTAALLHYASLEKDVKAETGSAAWLAAALSQAPSCTAADRYSTTVYTSMLKKRAPWTTIKSRKRFSLVKYLDASDFVVPATWFAFSAVWRQPDLPFDVPTYAWQVFAIAGIAMLSWLGGTYIVKAALQGYRVKQEWNDVNMAHGFAYPPLCLLLLAFLAVEWDMTLAEWLLYCGSTLQAMLAVTSMSKLLHEYRCLDQVSPQYLLPALSCFVAAMATTVVMPDKTELVWAWITAGAVSSGLIAALITVRLASRPLAGNGNHAPAMSSVLVAVPAVAAVAAYGLAPLATDAPLGTIGRLCTFAAWFMGAALVYAAGEPGPWANSKFSILSWQHALAATLLTLATSHYHAATQSWTSKRLVWVGFWIAVAASLKLTLHTLLGLLQRKWVFVPRPKLHPLCVTALAYPALCSASGKLAQALGDLLGITDDAKWDQAMRMVHYRLALLKVLFTETTHQEQSVVFPVVGSLVAAELPEVRPAIGDLARRLANIQLTIQTLPMTGAGVDPATTPTRIRLLVSAVSAFGTTLANHCDLKATKIMPVAAKYLGHEAALRLQQQLWRATSIDRWRYIIPTVVNNLGRGDALRYLAAWRLGMSEHMQLIGQMVYEGVPNAHWTQLEEAMPELVPAFVANHRGGLAD